MKDLVKKLSDLDWVDTNHHGVQKKVCFGSNVFESKITQVAYSEIGIGGVVDNHLHETMEEVFIIMDGLCEFIINDKLFLAGKNSIVRIPANSEHRITAITDSKFFYFGVSVF